MPDAVHTNESDTLSQELTNTSSTTHTTYVGCADLPPGLRRQRYFQRLEYLETEGTRWQIPKARVLRNWREEAGPNGRFGLLAPQIITDKPGPKGYPHSDRTLSPEQLSQAGEFRSSPVVEQAVQELVAACAVIDADVAVFRSPPNFAPSAANRDALRKFFTEVASPERFGSTLRVWEPQGLWEQEAAARFANTLGVVYAYDPLTNDPLATPPEDMVELLGDTVYVRVSGLGQSNQRFDDYALEPLSELVGTCARAWIVFAHIHKYPDAIRCRRLFDSQDEM